MDEIRTTCPYCGVGCGVLARKEENGLVSVRGDERHPANLGRLCVKGAALGETTGLEGRLLRPELEGEAGQLVTGAGGRRQPTAANH
ncbi:Formate dehydrogenase, nitrate-inducible, major subunit precursor [Raoultella planticola]|uniref:Formate dehydrogenase, nitrate-inducible, major subunit n=1 Tax=Raoultella planticola TaxID=575 RepID=A0A485ATE5_RAOPL|nr:Formate dehydrogenase, nitrate-inducible, major subunit precursor [Raoultella planticola]